MEIWLRSNRRPLVAPFVCGLAGTAFLVPAALGWFSLGPTLRLVCLVALAVGALANVVLGVALAWAPRVAYRSGQVLFYLKRGSPIAVPLSVVECFLLGQASASLGGESAPRREAATVVARIAEKAEPWRQMEVDHALGTWCSGYAVIYGTWCEPLDVEVVQRMNRKLAAAQRDADRAAREGRHAS